MEEKSSDISVTPLHFASKERAVLITVMEVQVTVIQTLERFPVAAFSLLVTVVIPRYVLLVAGCFRLIRHKSNVWSLQDLFKKVALDPDKR